MLVFILKSCYKKVDWYWKREKKFYVYSGTNVSLFRLWLRLLHVMLAEIRFGSYVQMIILSGPFTHLGICAYGWYYFR
jgi:hypothetical protein